MYEEDIQKNNIFLSFDLQIHQEQWILYSPSKIYKYLPNFLYLSYLCRMKAFNNILCKMQILGNSKFIWKYIPKVLQDLKILLMAGHSTMILEKMKSRALFLTDRIKRKLSDRVKCELHHKNRVITNSSHTDSLFMANEVGLVGFCRLSGDWLMWVISQPSGISAIRTCLVSGWGNLDVRTVDLECESCLKKASGWGWVYSAPQKVKLANSHQGTVLRLHFFFSHLVLNNFLIK